MVPFEEVKTIPPEWKLLPFGEVARSQSCDSNLIKGKQANAPGPGLYPAFSASGQDVWTTKPHHEGDAIIVSAVGARCGKCFRASGQWSAVANTHIIWPDPKKVDADFLWRVINDEDFWVRGQSAQPYVQVSATKHKLVPVPPLPEQQRIAQVLSTVQQAIEQQERLIRTTTELKQALMQKLFTEGLRGEAQKETEIGAVPESWEVVTLGSLAEVISKGSSPKWQGFEYQPTGVLFVRSQNVGDGRMLLDDLVYLSEAFNLKEKRSILKEADLLINLVGASIGRVALGTSEIEGANCNQAVCFVRLKGSHALKRFMVSYLLSPAGQELMRQQKKDIARANLSLLDVRNFLVPLPKNEADTEEVAQAFTTIEKKLAHHETKRNTLQALFRTLLHELMTGRLRIPLIVKFDSKQLTESRL